MMKVLKCFVADSRCRMIDRKSQILKHCHTKGGVWIKGLSANSNLMHYKTASNLSQTILGLFERASLFIHLFICFLTDQQVVFVQT